MSIYKNIGIQSLVKMEKLYITNAFMRSGSLARKDCDIIASAPHSFSDRIIPELRRSFPS